MKISSQQAGIHSPSDLQAPAERARPGDASQGQPRVRRAVSFQESAQQPGTAKSYPAAGASPSSASSTADADPLANPHLYRVFGVKDVPPHPRDAARDFARNYLKQHHIDANPDEIYLTAHFPPSASVPKGYDEKIMSMTDMVLHNRQAEFTDSSYGLVRTDLSGASGKPIPGLDRADFQRHIWSDNFAAIYSNRIDAYFAKNGDAVGHALSAGMAKTLTQQVSESSLSPKGADLVSRGLGLGPYVPWSRRELDNFTHRQPDATVSVQPLKINDAVSTQAYLFTDKASGKTVMYLPGNSSPFHEFDKASDIADWFQSKVADGDAGAKQQFRSYFPEDKAKYVDIAYGNLKGHPERAHQGDYLRPNFGGEPLKGDTVSGMVGRLREEYQTKGNEQITSDEQWGRRKAVEAIGAVSTALAPLALVAPGMAAALGVGLGVGQLGLGAYMANQGRSSQERKEGKQVAAFGFLNAASNAVGAETGLAGAASKGAKGTTMAKASEAAHPPAPESHLQLGLGAPSDVPANINSRYETKLRAIDAHLQRNPARKQEFEAGVASPDAVALPPDLDNKSLEELKKAFIEGQEEGTFSYKELGALSSRIKKKEQERLIVVTLQKTQEVAHDWQKNGATEVRWAPQGLILTVAGDTSGGRCLPLVRAMAVAIDDGKDVEIRFTERLFEAAGEKQRQLDKGQHQEFKKEHPMMETLALLHGGGVDMPRANTTVVNIDKATATLESERGNAYYELNTSRHSMMVAVQQDRAGHRTFVFYDPNFGVARFDHASQLNSALKTHFIKRGLASIYEHVGDDKRMPQFNMAKIDVDRMRNYPITPGYTVERFVTEG